MQKNHKDKILCVDDEEIQRYSIARILRQGGFEVIEAENGEQALRFALEQPNLILLDVNLPDMDGFEVCRRLRKDPATRFIPILHLSAKRLDTRSTVTGLESGADGYLTLPIEPEVLVAHIKAVIRSYQLELYLKKTNRSIKATSLCRQALLRAKEESELVREICRVLVEVGGYYFVFVGHETPNSPLPYRMIGTWGEKAIAVGIEQKWTRLPLPSCPMKRAIDTKKLFVPEDVTTDPFCKDWADIFRGTGVVSAAAFPFPYEDEIWGAVCICSQNEGIFDREEVELLTGLVNDLSYGIEKLKTQQKAEQARIAMQESELRFRTLFENAADAIYIVEAEGEDAGRIVQANPFAARMHGYTLDELTNMKLWDLDTPEQANKIESRIERLFREGRLRDETAHRRKDGTVFPLEINASLMVIHGRKYILAVDRDISEHKEAEEQLRESEERFRLAFENANVAVCLVDLDGRLLQVNKRMCDMFGYDKSELEGMTVNDIAHPEDKGLSSDFIRRAWSGEVSEAVFEKRYFHKDGHVVWGRISSALVRDKSGAPTYFISHILDLTESKLSEERHRLLATAVEHAAEEVIITDTEGIIQYVNPAFERITGYSRSEAIGENPRLVKSGEHDATFYQDLWDTIKSGKTWTGRFTNKKKDGTIYYEDAAISPVRDDSDRIVNFVAVKRDVTENLRLNKQLLQAQKMEAIGTLAGGVAHDFNNILQVALGYSQILMADRSLTDRQRSDIKKIYDSSVRGADLVKRLMTFSRKTETRPRPLNLNDRILELAQMLQRTLPKMIDVELLLSPDLARINGDATQIDQVLINLAVNARDAMPDGGTLTVETQNITLDSSYARRYIDVKPGLYAMLLVSDTGTGMSKDTLEHIFEPFFTTKQTGHGTGLGLAMVHGIVASHDGHIRCYSELGQGTSFKIYFPSCENEVEQQEIKAIPEAPGGSETILIVDDEAMIREMGTAILKDAGYTIITANNGRQALELYGQHGDQIAVVILDLGMPQMGGKQCLQALLEMDSKAKVIVASGYPAREEVLALGAKDFVHKPYDVRIMLHVVRSVIENE